MQTNNHKIVDYDAVLDAKFGKEGTPERARAEEAAYSFYSGQILQDARKEAKMTRCHYPQCWCILSYHCSARNEGGSGEACVLIFDEVKTRARSNPPIPSISKEHPTFGCSFDISL